MLKNYSSVFSKNQNCKKSSVIWENKLALLAIFIEMGISEL